MRAGAALLLFVLLAPAAASDATSWSTTRSFPVALGAYATHPADEFRVSADPPGLVDVVLTWTEFAQLEFASFEITDITMPPCDAPDPVVCDAERLAASTKDACDATAQRGIAPTEGGTVSAQFYAGWHDEMFPDVSGTRIQVRTPFAAPGVSYTLTLTSTQASPILVEGVRRVTQVDPDAACRALG